MLTVNHKDNTVKLTAEFCGYYWHFCNTCPQECWAVLLRDKLAAELFSAMQLIRREAYDHGWADAKAHRAKCDYFTGLLP